ncbi:hypothetical protein WJ96_07720 [Burkholderia ubonensis]|uniref:Uncharacterized protein n=1 Tax=Burkholderia ubonensis TaxID=101571 RepID=A0AAW3MZL1_9BURK|nr:hypothetical protein [Burkholderia ubonensis]KVP75588.1 hypothetical protein WJ93_09520 [Burkholderia ubonensis]KVP97050.1 hypothetical protein WJ97_14625 [Burkholderia ubonensis]KVP98400.1 hypothetical protein WJ96_07720 [Burkholderia ubonensis]KVZ93099.1 hypothetical protein WL25_19385 [Burkholderia ubonensis]
MEMTKTQMQVVKWLAAGKTGLSSKAMAFRLGFGLKPSVGGRSYPHDPSDFNRCLGLLRAAPALRKKLPEMAKLSKEWKRLVAAWDRIEAVFEREVGPDWSKNQSVTASETYHLMREVLEGRAKKHPK